MLPSGTVALTVISVSSGSATYVYSVVSGSNAGLNVPCGSLVTVNELNDLLSFFLLILIVYVFLVVPSCAVTTTSSALSPTLKFCSPSPVTSASESDLVYVILTLVLSFATSGKLYV